MRLEELHTYNELTQLIINNKTKAINTLNSEKYIKYQKNNFKKTYFDELIKDFDIIEIEHLNEYFEV